MGKNEKKYYQANFDYLNDYNDLLNKIDFKKKENLKKIKNITDTINNLNQTKTKFTNKKITLEKEISELEIEFQVEDNKIEDYNSKNHSNLKIRIELINNKLKDIKLKIEDLETKSTNLNTDLNFLNENNNKIFNISNEIKELEEIKKNDKLSKKHKEEILAVLNNSFEKLNENIEKDSNFDLSKISFFNTKK